MNNVINKLKKDTNNDDNIVYRKKKILYKEIYIIYNQTITSSSDISNFIIRSLNNIYIPTIKNIKNKINNFKYKELNNYNDLTYYLNSGFTIIIYSQNKYMYLFHWTISLLYFQEQSDLQDRQFFHQY